MALRCMGFLPSTLIASLLLASHALLSLAGCASHQVASTPAHRPASLSALAEQHHVCAVTVAVIKNRRLDAVESASGCTSDVVKLESVFQAASLSKPLFAYGVLNLVAEGKLALDAPIVRYLPQAYRHRFDPLKAEPSELVTDPRLGAITVRMALNHTSGLPNWASGPLRFSSEPGAKWDYSGEGYLLLQQAVEAVTGQPLDRFMAAQVFQPLAMQHSDYVWNERIANQLLPGTKANGAPRKTIELKTPLAAFSLHTSAADYGRFLVKLLNDESAIRQVTAAPVTVDPSLGLSWGLGWGIEQSKDDLYIWQWGNNPGYRAFVIASTRTGDGFVMLTNSENGLELAKPLAARVLRSEPKLFQSSILGFDVLNFFCTNFRVCF